MRRKTESLKRNPGISRLLVLNEQTGEWSPPSRGKSFRAIRQTTGPDGSPRRETQYCESLSEAQSFRRGSGGKGLRSAIRRDDAMQLPTPMNTSKFEELVERWREQKLIHLEASTQARSCSYLKHFKFFHGMIVSEIGASEIDLWLSHLKTPEYLAVSNPTRCNYVHEFGVLKAILGFYRERLDPTYSLPFRRDHRKMLVVRTEQKPIKDLSRDEVERFFVALDEICAASGNPEIPFLARVQYATAARIQEAAALKVSDFDLASSQVHVCRRIQWVRSRGVKPIIRDGTKFGAGKILPMNRALRDLLTKAKLQLGVREGFLFFRNGEPLSYREIEYRYTQAFLRAGIGFSGTHILRHAALSEVQASSKDLCVTMKIAGHRDTKSAIRYAKARESDVASALDSLSSECGASPYTLETVGSG